MLFSTFATTMSDKEIFTQKAQTLYAVCFQQACPLREDCLRWLVGEEMPATKWYYTCVNHRMEGVGTSQCPNHRPRKKVMMARGMTGTFTADMPQRVLRGVRSDLISVFGRTTYFKYRRGENLLHPTQQERVKSIFRRHGWTEEVRFDRYEEHFDWE